MYNWKLSGPHQKEQNRRRPRTFTEWTTYVASRNDYGTTSNTKSFQILKICATKNKINVFFREFFFLHSSGSLSLDGLLHSKRFQKTLIAITPVRFTQIALFSDFRVLCNTKSARFNLALSPKGMLLDKVNYSSCLCVHCNYVPTYSSH